MEESRKTRNGAIRAGLAAGLAATAASVLTFVAVDVVVSLYATWLHDLYGESGPVLEERASRLFAHLSALNATLGAVTTFAVAVLAARGVSRGHARQAGIVGVGSWAGAAILGGASTFRPLDLAEALVCAGAGAAIGWAIREPSRVLVQITQALRTVRTTADIATRMAATGGTGCRPTVRLWQSTGGTLRPIAGSASKDGEPIDAPDTPPAPHELRRAGGLLVRRPHGRPIATLWALLPRERGETSLLEVATGYPWFYLRMRRSMWRAAAQVVGRVFDDVAAVDEARHAALLAERERIGRDIHDTLAQDVLSAVMHIEAAQLGDAQPSSIRGHLDVALSSAREALSGARKVVWASRTKAIDDTPLRDALSELVTGWRERTAIAADMVCHGPPERLRRDVEEALLRVTNEALRNVHKHARANDVMVTLSYMESAVTLDVKDDGHGFEPSTPRHGGGFGLVSMREQVQDVGGDLTVETRPGGGTTVAVVVPRRTREAAF